MSSQDDDAATGIGPAETAGTPAATAENPGLTNDAPGVPGSPLALTGSADELALTAAVDEALVALEPGAARDEIRRRGVREALADLVTKVTAERAIRAEASAAASREAAEIAVAEVRERPPFSPFRTGLLGGLGVLLAYVTYQSLDTIRGTLIVIAVAALLAIGLDPAVRFLQRHRWRRGHAVAVVFVGLLLVLVGAVVAIIPPVVEQVGNLVESAPQYLEDLQQNPTIKNLDEKFGVIERLQDSAFIQQIGSGAVSVGFTVAAVAFDLFVVLILAMYFLGGLPKMKSAAYRLAPASKRPRVTELGEKIVDQMGGYLSGATLIALQAGLVAGVFAWIVGLPYPWAIALGAAVLDFIPVIGPIVVGISMMLIGFTQSVTIGIIAAAFYLTQHLFEAYWLYPKVMKRTVDISAAGVVVAILIGGALLGVTGALLAVPVAAAAQLIVREVIMPMQERA